MNRAEQLGIRVIVDLVVNHTSDQHPGSRRRASDPKSPYRDWYVWAKKRPADHSEGIVFPGVQKTTWTLRPRGRRSTTSTASTTSSPTSTRGTRPCAREILQDHGLLAAARRLAASAWTPCRSSSTKKGAGVAARRRTSSCCTRCASSCSGAAGDAILLAEANVAARREHELLRRRGRPHADDAQLPRQPAAVLRAGHRRPRPARARRSSRRASARATRSGSSSCAATTSSISAG